LREDGRIVHDNIKRIIVSLRQLYTFRSAVDKY